MREKLRIGVIGAGRWAASAHLPGFLRSPLSELVAICDLDRDMAKGRAEEFGIPHVETDAEKILSREDIDVVDVVTRGEHQDLVFATLEAGKHCLVEKPVCHDYKDVWRAHELAQAKGLKTKVGLTFRYAPAVMYMLELIREGFIGDPFIFNGFEQNSQWLDPENPMDKRIHKTKPVGEAPWGTDLSREGITVFKTQFGKAELSESAVGGLVSCEFGVGTPDGDLDVAGDAIWAYRDGQWWFDPVP